jgi:hypothetical protein
MTTLEALEKELEEINSQLVDARIDERDQHQTALLRRRVSITRLVHKLKWQLKSEAEKEATRLRQLEEIRRYAKKYDDVVPKVIFREKYIVLDKKVKNAIRTHEGSKVSAALQMLHALLSSEEYIDVCENDGLESCLAVLERTLREGTVTQKGELQEVVSLLEELRAKS